MCLTIDTYMWLQYRKFEGLPDLRQEGDFIIATSSDSHFVIFPLVQNIHFLVALYYLSIFKLKTFPLQWSRNFIVNM